MTELSARHNVSRYPLPRPFATQGSSPRVDTVISMLQQLDADGVVLRADPPDLMSLMMN